jgi:hypothetical protein
MYGVGDEKMMIDNEVEGIWNEAVMASLRYYPGIRLRHLRQLRALPEYKFKFAIRLARLILTSKKKSKAIPVTGRGGL